MVGMTDKSYSMLYDETGEPVSNHSGFYNYAHMLEVAGHLGRYWNESKMRESCSNNISASFCVI